MLEIVLRNTEKIIPKNIFNFMRPIYHWILALIGAVVYGFPSKKINVVAITGTKGKSSTVEIISAILEEAGYKTALSNTIRFKIGNESSENKYKMSMPGRFAMQRFLRKAVKEGCNYAILEMTSQGAITYRHKWIYLDSFIFTNLAPEHIEAHGSYENYKKAKFMIAKSLEKSPKKNKYLIVNADDKEAPNFLSINVSEKRTYSIKDAEPYTLKKEGLEFNLAGKTVKSKLSGIFNIYNILAGATFARTQGISDETIIRAIEKFSGIPGRMQRIEAGQDFSVIVDYAHTPDSLEKVYQVFTTNRKICVLGNCGGGRDKWKRREMAEIADRYCEEIILTDEDPYDDDPMEIVKEMKDFMPSGKAKIIIDRREAIAKAISLAKTGDAVIITGKGTDPYIMGPNNSKIPWSDAKVASEELKKVLNANAIQA